MNYYISDTHFGHRNVIRFDNRPFDSEPEMTRAIMENWNAKVRPDDHVWILGDFCYKSERSPEWYLRNLSGIKHLVIGNHDHAVLSSPKALKHFESVDQIAETADNLNGEKIRIVMCHFPIASWNAKHYGSYHIFGHIHNNVNRANAAEFMANCGRALNAGCMINDYAPASVEELVRNNRQFWLENNLIFEKEEGIER